MTDSFLYDLFLSHSSKDKPVVRAIAERLRADGLRVWFDEWEIRPGDHIPARIEDGLERSRVLVLCMSANAFGSDWAKLEAGTFRFRDPLNRERRFIPLRLDQTPVRGSLAQFLYIDWGAADGYAKLREACRVQAAEPAPTEHGPGQEAPASRVTARAIELDDPGAAIRDYAFSPDGRTGLTAGGDGTVRRWDLTTGRCLGIFRGHAGQVTEVACRWDRGLALSSSGDGSLRLWDIETRRCLRLFAGHSKGIFAVSWSRNGQQALSASDDHSVRWWDVETGRCLGHFTGHTATVYAVAWSPDQRFALSASLDKTVRLWEVETGRCLRVFEGHTGLVWSVAWSPDGRLALSGGGFGDETVRLWDVASGRCLSVLEDPGTDGDDTDAGAVTIAWSEDGRLAVTGSRDKNVRLWDLAAGRLLCVLHGHSSGVASVRWLAQDRVISGDWDGHVRVWDLSEYVAEALAQDAPALAPVPEQVQYTNAKVLLVGESGAGKTGLSMRLALNDWQPSDSTVGAWATQWKLPVSAGSAADREIWLWDFGGQADQRLIHQLYMDDTALAVLVFDGQKDEIFERLDQWDRDLTRASRKPFTKLLVAGRVDAGGLRVSRESIERFVTERGYAGFLETSAKENTGCESLRQAILKAIDWDQLACHTTALLFRQLKEAIIRLKESGRVLISFKELRDRLSSELRFTDAELQAVLTLLAGPGVVWELKFGSWVLLQPERINAYAQAVIRTLKGDAQERGCLLEEPVLKGDLTYPASMARLQADEERFVLQAMHQMLLERGLCLRQTTDGGDLLIFPSYYRRERPEQVSSPAVLVSYRFTGFLDEIYATLVVHLHHTKAFQQDQLWRDAADFRTYRGKGLGLKLTRRARSTGELEVYFDPTVSMDAKIAFSKYVHEHLLAHAAGVERFRHYVCDRCGTPVGNREVAMKRLNGWLQARSGSGKPGEESPTIICAECEERVPLWDDMEACFAGPETRRQVRAMQRESAIVLDNESKERSLVGDVISTVALAGQICREFSVSDHGIDMEIEFKDENHEATGQRLYLQLKSGDSYLRERKSDGAELFTIKDQRHVRYWMAQPAPVLLVIRTSDGAIRWMEVSDWLRRASANGTLPVTQIEFVGERFDVMAVRRWRDRLLGAAN